jgi:hypothetical protein
MVQDRPLEMPAEKKKSKTPFSRIETRIINTQWPDYELKLDSFDFLCNSYLAKD